MRRAYIGRPGARVEYEPPDKLIKADPRIEVIDSYAMLRTDGHGVLRLLFGDAVLVYKVVGPGRPGCTIMEWPD